MDDGTPDDSSSGVTIGDVSGGIHRSVIAGRDIIAQIVNTGDYNQFFVGDYVRLADAYISAQSVFDRVDLDRFTGREWLLSAVDTFLQQRDRGYFVLQADAGLGKTTFLAWLVRQRGYIHHFCELAPGQEGIGSGLRNLAAQLALAYDLIPDGVLTRAADRPDYLYDLLKQAASKLGDGEKIVLVVDALDEAGTPLHQNVLGLPSALPGGVYIIASQRPQHVDLLVDTPLTPHYPYLLAAESDNNRDDMRRFLSNAAAWLGTSKALQQSGYTSKQFIATLLEKCRGVWIYLRYVVHEIELGERSPLALDALPDGMAQYYAAYWQRWRVQGAGEQRILNPRWHQVYRPFLSTLAASQEPSTFEQLAAWADVSASDAEELRLLCSNQWRPFLAAIGKGRQTRYRFYHATLLEFFEGRLALDRTPQHADLVHELAEATHSAHVYLANRYLEIWGGLVAQLPGLKDPKLRNWDHGYGLRHLATHLAVVGDISRLNALLCVEWKQSRNEPHIPRGWRKYLDKLSGRQPTLLASWYENAWFGCKDAAGQSDGYLADVTRAWRLAEMQAKEQSLSNASGRTEVTGGPPNAAALQCRFALIIASLNSLAQNIPPSLLAELVKKNVWQARQGLVYARQVPDSIQRVKALLSLTPYHSAGEREQVLQEALRITQNIEDSSDRARVLIMVAPHLAEQGQLQDVLRTAESLENSYPRAQVLEAVAPYLPTGEQDQVLQEALRIAHGIEHAPARDYALGAVASHLAKQGQLQKALHITQGIEGSSYRDNALGAVASYLAKQGQLQEALGIAQSIEDTYYRAQALAAVCPYLPTGEQDQVLHEALRIAQGIEDSSFRARALAAVCPHLVERGQLQEALRIVQGIEHTTARERALEAVASHLAERGQLQEALRIVQDIRNRSARARALAAVASQLAKQGQLQEALHIAQDIEDTHQRAQSLAAVASQLAKQGQLQEALRIAQNIKDSSARAQALAAVAPHLAEQGQVQEALRIAQNIHSSYRAQTLAAVAPHLAEQGQLQEALRIAQNIGDSSYRAHTLGAVASHLAEQGQLQEVLRIAQGIERSSAGAQALAAVASHLAEQGQLQEALRIGQGIEHTPAGAQALAAVAPHLAEQGQLQEALRIAQSIVNTYYRGQAMAAVASHLAKQVQLQEALRIVQNIKDSSARERALAAVCPHLAKQGKVEEALRIAQGIEDSYPRAQALAAVVPYLPTGEQDQVLQEALRIAQGIEDTYYRAQAFAAVAPHLAERGLLQEALRIVQGIEHIPAREQTLAAVASHLTKQVHLQEALRIVQNVESSSFRARTLAAVCPHLAGQGQLQEALRIAQGIEDASCCAQALAGVSPYLPTGAQDQVLQEALRIAQGIVHTPDGEQALAAVASRLVEQGQLQEALRIAQGMERSSARAQTLAAVAKALTIFPRSKLFAVWLKTLLVSSSRTRADLLSDLGAMAPVIHRLGGTTALVETAQAIQDVGRWWP